MENYVLLRPDGSSVLGIGHIMRGIALAQGLEGFKIKPLFISRNYDQRIARLIKSYGYQVKLLPPNCSFKDEAYLILKVASEYKARVITLDLSNTDTLTNLFGYEKYVRSLKQAGKFLIAIDGFGSECISTQLNLPLDIIIVPYFRAEEKNYKTIASTKLLLGTKYFLFRKEFIKATQLDRDIEKDAQNILVTMGGGDVFSLTLKVAKALVKLKRPYLNFKIVLGITRNPLLAKQEIGKVLAVLKRRYKFITESHNMAGLMLWADLAVINSGLTRYETAITGTPSIVISTNDVQEEIMDEFEQYGSVLHLGQRRNIHKGDIIKTVDRLLANSALREQMSKKGKKLVDGKGVERIISQMQAEI